MQRPAVIVANKYPEPADDGKKVVLSGLLRYLTERIGPERVVFIVVGPRPLGGVAELPCPTLWIQPPGALVKLWNAFWWCLVRRRKTIQEALLYSRRVREELTREVEGFLTARMPEWKKTRPAVTKLKVAVMGCVVNGPGESRTADIGISLPGTGEAPRSPVYVDGKQVATLEGDTLADDFKRMIEEYVARMPEAADPPTG